MKVILLEDIDRLGKIGDVISVKEGYARNYLIPKKKASPATDGNMKMLDTLKKKRSAIENAKLKELKALADKISGLSVTITTEAGEEDKLYGSVTAEMIAGSLELEGLSIDKKDIILEDPIKELGAYQVVVKVAPEIKANLRIWVVKK